MPAQVTGLHGVAQAGDSFMVAKNDQEAKEIAMKRSQIRREQDARHTHGRLSLDRVFDRIKEGEIKEVRLIIKADVDGSVEVLSDTLGAISNEEVKTNIIHRAVGTITERDVLLAAASDAIIIGFQVALDPGRASCHERNRSIFALTMSFTRPRATSKRRSKVCFRPTCQRPSSELPKFDRSSRFRRSALSPVVMCEKGG